MINQRYFKVKAKCGHVRKKYFLPVEFAVMASSAKEAASIARHIPRVKHDHKDAISSIEEISYEEYELLRIENEENPYLNCKNKQEQNINCGDLYLYVQKEFREKYYRFYDRKSKVRYYMRKYKDLEDDVRNYLRDYEEYQEYELE